MWLLVEERIFLSNRSIDVVVWERVEDIAYKDTFIVWQSVASSYQSAEDISSISVC